MTFAVDRNFSCLEKCSKRSYVFAGIPMLGTVIISMSCITWSVGGSPASKVLVKVSVELVRLSFCWTRDKVFAHPLDQLCCPFLPMNQLKVILFSLQITFLLLSKADTTPWGVWCMQKCVGPIRSTELWEGGLLPQGGTCWVNLALVPAASPRTELGTGLRYPPKYCHLHVWGCHQLQSQMRSSNELCHLFTLRRLYKTWLAGYTVWVQNRRFINIYILGFGHFPAQLFLLHYELRAC